MSDDDADPELLALLRQHLMGKLSIEEEPETGVLEGAEFVYDNAIDVALDMRSTKNAAAAIYAQMQTRNYSTATWSEPELHPKAKDEATVAFIFTMDLLNFSFWSDRPESDRFAVSYRGKRWTGYWSLVASLQRALDEGLSWGQALLFPVSPVLAAFPSNFSLTFCWAWPGNPTTGPGGGHSSPLYMRTGCLLAPPCPSLQTVGVGGS
ncbi:hypothetical protein VTK73DRAFT_8272 [Phialemonium thermophilum]|uniref:Queuosine 5'-phosphate N-glycosylase/hydrolase n=1 Tax=Phialemonium thermophilum TaxID=223376 RepID=A0ABR3W9H2_9PEZI